MREVFIFLFGLILGIGFDRVAGDWVDVQVVRVSAAVDAYKTAD